MPLLQTTIKNILTRTSGYLNTVSSHSLQPYRGCTFGHSLCGVACYVRHNGNLTQGRQWGDFLEVRTNAAESYLANVERERRWIQRRGQPFSIFCSSATDPFVPQEARFGITRQILEAMLQAPPEVLILQTHSARVVDYLPLYLRLRDRCQIRVHVSIETDREELPGLPRPASPLEKRVEACRRLREAGIRTVVTVAPLLPIAEPEQFFARLAKVADAVVLDHFMGGDGTPDGRRTLRTALPAAMAAVDPASVTLAYRDAMVQVAQRYFPGKVGVCVDGFAGRFLPKPS